MVIFVDLRLRNKLYVLKYPKSKIRNPKSNNFLLITLLLSHKFQEVNQSIFMVSDKTKTKILKFGGTSLSTPERLQQAVNIICNPNDGMIVTAVVVSAFGGTTDHLIQMGERAESADKKYQSLLAEFREKHIDAVKSVVDKKRCEIVLNQIESWCRELEDILDGVFKINQLTPKTLDKILCFGELCSAFILSHCFPENESVEFLDAREVIVTDDSYGSAKVLMNETQSNVKNYFGNQDSLQIITGFIGADEKGKTTTLGRGGSDFTASILGVILKVSKIEIWTDVDGVMTADPEKVKTARTLNLMSYEEAMEMSHFGAKVIYPPTIQPAVENEIPIHIRNTFKPDESGTEISIKTSPSRIITGISSIPHVVLIRVEGSGMVGVPGVAGRLFGTLAHHGVNVILITQASSEHSICFAVRRGEGEKSVSAINNEFALEMKTHLVDEVVVEREYTVLAVVGENMRHTHGIAGKIFSALGNSGVNVAAIAQGSSELNISIVVKSDDEVAALNSIHNAFFDTHFIEINLFMIGTGNVGSTLLDQIESQKAVLQGKYGIQINVAGLANSKKMIFKKDGIEINSFKTYLDESDKPFDLRLFKDQTIDMQLQNKVFVDCTADSELPAVYEQMLGAGVSVVTPNKIANSSDFNIYQSLQKIAAVNSVIYGYEATVGAGLPILKTVRDLLDSGDEIHKVEAVLSGTLSYIFNSLSEDFSFSEIIKDARDKGYTEPDPRVDLEGEDVVRKLVILGRESGFELSPEDVKVESLISNECRESDSIETFFDNMEKMDSHYENLHKKADEEGKVLRYIGVMENGRASAKIKTVESNHPFYHLEGTENIFAFYTRRYSESPLVIRGPGAGPAVTAQAVFNDILSTAK